MTEEKLLESAIDLLKDIDWAYKLTPGRSAKIAQIVEEYEKGEP